MWYYVCFVSGRFGHSFPSLSSQQPLQPTAGAVVNVAGSSRSSDRVVLVVDDTRFIIDLEALRAYPNTMLGRLAYFVVSAIRTVNCHMSSVRHINSASGAEKIWEKLY